MVPSRNLKGDAAGGFRVNPAAAPVIAGFNHRVGKGLRRLLRRVVPDAAGDEAVDIPAGKLLGVGIGVRMRRAVGVTFKGDGGDRDDGKLGQPLFQGVIPRLPPALDPAASYRASLSNSTNGA
jgi:hypothetical protein